MAIFSQKSDRAQKADQVDKPEASVAAENAGPTFDIGHNSALVIPRLSEKGSLLNRLNKYVFKIEGKMNKVELKKAIERTYGAKVTGINMITVQGKTRRYGKVMGKRSGFKKAIVTLSPDSKKIDFIQGA